MLMTIHRCEGFPNSNLKVNNLNQGGTLLISKHEDHSIEILTDSIVATVILDDAQIEGSCDSFISDLN